MLGKAVPIRKSRESGQQLRIEMIHSRAIYKYGTPPTTSHSRTSKTYSSFSEISKSLSFNANPVNIYILIFAVHIEICSTMFVQIPLLVLAVGYMMSVTATPIKTTSKVFLDTICGNLSDLLEAQSADTCSSSKTNPPS